MNIFNVFNESQSIIIYHNGRIFDFISGSEAFNDIIAVWNDTCANARNMPAYGVSLNSETLKAVKHGLWLEFCFGKVNICNDLPFERLLIEVKAELTGFNLIRYETERGYDGRCFYFNLVNRDMSALFNILNSEISKISV